MKRIAFLSGLISGFLTFGILPAFSEVLSDGTTNTTVNTIGNNFTILNGIQRGSNLFHSFGEFSIPTGGEATFQNPSAIENIINRVTGGNVSNIDGLIKANGSANVFLINPAGIVFGENARLDIGGSFLGTTAQSIVFEDGFNYSAIETHATPLLTVSVPLGLQMGTNPGAIEVNGTGHNLITNDINFAPYINQGSLTSLQVKPGKTLALIGGDITLDGGILNSETGIVSLSSIRDGFVNLNQNNQSFTLDVTENSKFGNIQLSQKSLIDVSGASAGSINIRGSYVSLKDGSVLYVQNRGIQPAGDTNINATQSLEINGISPDGKIRSALLNETFAGSNGNINVITPRLIITNGGAIANRTFSSAPGGNISINATELIEVSGFSTINPEQFSLIASTTFREGKSGDISFFTKELSVLDGAAVAATSFGRGNGGNININAQNIEVKASGSGLFINSTIASTAIGESNGGNININTRNLIINEDANINTVSNNSGNAGNVTITATESVRIINESRLESSVLPNPVLESIFNLPKVPNGNGGNITINTPFLLVSDESLVSVANLGTGDAGFLKVTADKIKLDNLASLTATTEFGEGGNISLQFQSLQMRGESTISTSAGGAGNGGNIIIDTDTLVALENSDITANAENSFGGKVIINAQGIFGTQFRDNITTDSDITASSELGAEFNGTVDINNFGIDPSTGLIQLSVALADSSQQIATGCSSNTGSSFVATGRGGIPHNPRQNLNLNRTWSDIRDLSAYRQQRKNSTVENTLLSNQPAIVEATGFIRNSKGEIELVALENTPLINKQIADCSQINT